MTQWTLHMQQQHKGAQFPLGTIPSHPPLFGNHREEESHRLREECSHPDGRAPLADPVSSSSTDCDRRLGPAIRTPSQAVRLSLSDSSEVISAL